MKSLTITLTLVSWVSAFPGIMNAVTKRSDLKFTVNVETGPSDNPLVQQSRDETNCGPRGPCLTFNAADQYVSTTGQHVYQAPSQSDIRGPCPGLNAAANHGYLPRNGIATLTETIEGLFAAYAMGPDLAGVLAAYAIVMDGDVVTQRWSIGGPMPGVLIAPTGYQPQGISYSHNKYEGDTSLTREDAYINNGDAHSLIVSRFKTAYEVAGPEDRITLDKFRQVNIAIQDYSVKNNPYYFAPLFSTTLVAPAAYNFIINFMSNHSAAEPSGYLTGEVFKQFFAVSGDYPNFVWNKGQERIPDNWYRRPSANPYVNQDVVLDLLRGWAAYPTTFRFGGNTNGVNTYKGVDIAALTGGTFTNDNILEGNNFACLVFQTQQQAVPDFLKGLVNDLDEAVAFFNKYAHGAFDQFNCGPLAKYDAGPLTPYPGRTYNPTGSDNNY